MGDTWGRREATDLLEAMREDDRISPAQGEIDQLVAGGAKYDALHTVSNEM